VARAQTGFSGAPNIVVISPRLVTSGQPTAASLERLAEQGFGAVINLAPPTASDAVRDEAQIVRRQGLAFVSIPIRFDRPTERDFSTFAAALDGLADRKVLVHCQINLRASSMVYLYRVIRGHEDAQRAFDAVSQVWMPEGPWRQLIRQLLRQHKVAFDPFS
jgi:uncharacterized protein (TIGR01244 family)